MENKCAVEVDSKEKVQDRLERLGFKTASTVIKKLAERKRKMMIAGEFYRILKQDKIDAFNKKLRKSTENNYRFDQLSFTPISSYADTPPPEVLAELETAIGRNCFDSYEVAHIVKQVKVPDPLLLGRIDGCPDRFFITQWDDDVKIEDILAKNEG